MIEMNLPPVFLKMVRQSYREIAKKIKSSSITLNTAELALYIELTELQDQVDDRLKTLMSEFEMRVLNVRRQLMELHDWMKLKCSDQSDDKDSKEQGDSWFDMFKLFGSLVASPYANKDQICE